MPPPHSSFTSSCEWRKSAPLNPHFWQATELVHDVAQFHDAIARSGPSARGQIVSIAMSLLVYYTVVSYIVLCPAAMYLYIFIF